MTINNNMNCIMLAKSKGNMSTNIGNVNMSNGKNGLVVSVNVDCTFVESVTHSPSNQNRKSSRDTSHQQPNSQFPILTQKLASIINALPDNHAGSKTKQTLATNNTLSKSVYSMEERVHILQIKCQFL